MFQLLDVSPQKRPHIAQKHVLVSQLIQSHELFVHQFQTFIAWFRTIMDSYDTAMMHPCQTVEHILMLDIVVDT